MVVSLDRHIWNLEQCYAASTSVFDDGTVGFGLGFGTAWKTGCFVFGKVHPQVNYTLREATKPYLMKGDVCVLLLVLAILFCVDS